MIKVFKGLYLPARFFYLFGGVILFFVFSFFVEMLFPIAQTVLVMGLGVVFLDILMLFNPKIKVKTSRKMAKALSLGDENDIKIYVANLSPLQLKFGLIEELPYQFQKRDFRMDFELASKEKKTLTYHLRPTERGEYIFHNTNIFLQSVIGLVERRVITETEWKVPVYPSIIQMKKFELISVAKLSQFSGLKKIRRLGHSYEFEQIKNYVRGDDMRSINWKATGRRGELMVNQYEDEKSQQIYSVIDKSRVMSMPFNGLSLMDYAINASLVISNVALRKSDKAGLITYSDKVGAVIKASKKKTQLNQILNALYKQSHRKNEANFELLYRAARNVVSGRSLLFLYTNFESLYALQRVLPVLRKLNSAHLLVVVFFENTEIRDYADQKGANTEGMYMQTIAEKFVFEKKQIVTELGKYGIQAILTRPEELTINTVNKYLELKARGMI